MERISWKPFTADWRRRNDHLTKPFISTFRKGTKWFRADMVGQTVELYDEGHGDVFATAVVDAVKLCPLSSLDQIDLLRQTDECNTMDKALEVMRRVYGEYELDTLTTVLTLGVVTIQGGSRG